MVHSPLHSTPLHCTRSQLSWINFRVSRICSARLRVSNLQGPAAQGVPPGFPPCRLRHVQSEVYVNADATYKNSRVKKSTGYRDLNETRYQIYIRDVTCHMRSHSVTFHPTHQVNTPRLNAIQKGRYSIYPSRGDGRLS